ncbi:MAG: PQQ-binding-like beta-propeller repeat protein [Saprospiraceae bacterium]|nr:PQQ-binding-like beta-propeller repeat protein [Saprospiraceae bacterium]
MFKDKKLYLILIFALIGLSALSYWLFFNPVKDISLNLPEQDNRPEQNSENSEVVKIGEHFTKFEELSTTLTGKWSRFRGADYDNTAKDGIPLIDKFGNEGPKILWKVDLGEGHAAPAIYNGRVYLIDYIEEKKIDALRCFSLETGKEIWRLSYNVHVKRNHGMSRTIPAVNDSFIVTIGPKGHIMCANPISGKFLWGIDLIKEYKAEIPFWHTGQCPMIDSNIAVIAPAGKSLLIGVNCSTGKVIWETPNPDNWKMSHSSIMPMVLNGKKMYVYAAIGGICGISAQGDDVGKKLWKTNEFSPSVVAPSPVVLDNGKIYITAGYGAGAMLFQVKQDGENYSVEVLQQFKPKDGVASEQQTPIIYKDRMFVILPKDAGSNRNQFVCVDPNDCKNILWTSGKTDRFGLGPYIIADGKFFILDDDGTLTIAKASTSKFILLDKAKIIDGQDAWGPIAIADGMLLMRDSKQMVCIDIRKK